MRRFDSFSWSQICPASSEAERRSYKARDGISKFSRGTKTRKMALGRPGTGFESQAIAKAVRVRLFHLPPDIRDRPVGCPYPKRKIRSRKWAAFSVGSGKPSGHASLAQRPRALPCPGIGRGFESHTRRQNEGGPVRLRNLGVTDSTPSVYMQL